MEDLDRVMTAYDRRPKLEYNPQAAWERVRDEIVAKLLPSKQVKDRKKGQNPY